MDYPELLEFDNKEYLCLSKPYYRSKEPVNGNLYSLNKYRNDEEGATLSSVGLIDNKSILRTSEDEEYEEEDDVSKFLNVTIINSIIYTRFSEINNSIIKNSNLLLDDSSIVNSIIKNSDMVMNDAEISSCTKIDTTNYED